MMDQLAPEQPAGLKDLSSDQTSARLPSGRMIEGAGCEDARRVNHRLHIEGGCAAQKQVRVITRVMNFEQQYPAWTEHPRHFGKRAPVVRVWQSYATDDYLATFREKRQNFGRSTDENYARGRVVRCEERAPDSIRSRRDVYS